MKKNGFTLIEIIVSITLITLVGVGSFFGIRLISNNIRISKLEQIEDRILLAAETYIETNKESYNQLYEKNNGVVIPLNVLVNEGLLDLTTTTLEDEDIENEYVITALSGNSQQDNCVDIRSTTSWNEKLSEPIYICTDSNGNSNISIINPDNLSNKNKVEREIFYYKGEYPNNYIRYTKNGISKNMRILSVDTDDSITVVGDNWKNDGKDSFDKLFEQKESFTGISSYDTKISGSDIREVCQTDANGEGNRIRYYSSYNNSNGGAMLTQALYTNTVECVLSSYQTGVSSGSVYTPIYGNFYTDDKTWLEIGSNDSNRFLHLKPCMKITSGTGASDNPFILESKCS